MRRRINISFDFSDEEIQRIKAQGLTERDLRASLWSGAWDELWGVIGANELDHPDYTPGVVEEE